jgi:predicted nucleic acid-binding protein
MLINRVVVNASPLICLFKSGLEDLFPSLFNDIVVPEAVIKEVTAKGEADFAAQTLISLPWIRRMGDVPVDPRVAAWDLGDGESAVLSFALRNPEYWAILDDREARRCALSLQCHCIGTKSAFRFSSRPDHGISRRVPVVPIIPIDKLSEHTKSPIGESRVSVLGLPFDSAVRSCQDAPQPTRYVPPLPSSRQPQ